MINEKKDYFGDLLIYPCPVVLVTSKYNLTENVFAVSWTGIACSHPEYVTISINPKRFSHDIILNSKKFCINIPDSSLIDQTDYCGSCSGREIDKFTQCGFKKLYYNSDYILIDKCHFHLICDVQSIQKLGSHDLFIAKVTNKLVDKSVNDIIKDSDPFVYFRPNYHRIEKKPIGYYGYTISDS